MNIRISLSLLCTLAPAAIASEPSKNPASTDLTPPAWVEPYRAVAQRIISATLTHNDAYPKLEHLCLRIGHRLSGSKQLNEAIEWSMAAMKKDGLENVRAEKVMVPHWVRGEESATMLQPRVERLSMIGLGGSVGTPPEGVTGEMVVVDSEDALKSLGEKVKGKIVLFNHPMPPYDPERGSGYGTASKFRYNGARWAAEHGVLAALVRSATARSLRTPHTGGMSYGDAKDRIPTASLSLEDAESIAALTRLGVPVTVNLKMEAQSFPDAESANVIGELRGSTNPDEIVVISGHLDSWDAGHGAHDDGGPCVMAMEAVNVLRKLNLIPRRTIRVVLWTNEENGLAGAKTYVKDHAEELSKHVAAIEADSGVFKPEGYSFECADEARARRAAEQMNDILNALSGTFPDLKTSVGWSGADISQMKSAGVVLMGHDVEGSTYFDYHHTHADTLDKIDPQLLSENVAVLATVAYILADMPHRIGETPVP